jgi:hypothetical protein
MHLRRHLAARPRPEVHPKNNRYLTYYAAGVSVTSKGEDDACFEGYPWLAAASAFKLQMNEHFTKEENWEFFQGETCTSMQFDPDRVVADSGGMYS